MRDLELPERYNVGADLLDRNLKAGRTGKVAITSAGGNTTYGDLFKLACGAATTLRDLGVRREERVMLVAYDSPGWVAMFLGAIRLGAVPVPVNPLLQRSEDYDHYIDDSLARVVVVDMNTEEKLRAAVDRAGNSPRLVRAASAEAPRDSSALGLHDEMGDFPLSGSPVEGNPRPYEIEGDAECEAGQFWIKRRKRHARLSITQV